MSSETKIDHSFPKGQFLIKGFGDPLRIDRNVNGGGTLFYVRCFYLLKLYQQKAFLSDCETRLEPRTT